MVGDSERLGAVIAVGNQKGGVAKTTNTVNLAAALGLEGYRVLVVDLDPSAGATTSLGVPKHGFAGSLEFITEGEDPLELAITENMPKGVELIPARADLADLDKHLSPFDDPTSILYEPLNRARKQYDIILLDTPPNPRAHTTVAAYCSADWFLLSSTPHALAVFGLKEALKDIADARRKRNPRLEIIGLVFSCIDRRTKVAAEVETIVTRHFPDRAFSTGISQAIQLSGLPEKGKTVFQVKLKSLEIVAEQYRTIAREIAQRIRNRDAFLQGALAIKQEETSDIDASEPVPARPLVEPAPDEPSSADEKQAEPMAMNE
jgi:chromosome partitioning protein